MELLQAVLKARAMEEEIASSPFSRKVGDRLRVIRRQKRLSLQEVEANSAEEFKASVLGAYERGDANLPMEKATTVIKKPLSAEAAPAACGKGPTAPLWPIG